MLSIQCNQKYRRSIANRWRVLCMIGALTFILIRSNSVRFSPTVQYSTLFYFSPRKFTLLSSPLLNCSTLHHLSPHRIASLLCINHSLTHSLTHSPVSLEMIAPVSELTTNAELSDPPNSNSQDTRGERIN